MTAEIPIQPANTQQDPTRTKTCPSCGATLLQIWISVMDAFTILQKHMNHHRLVGQMKSRLICMSNFLKRKRKKKRQTMLCRKSLPLQIKLPSIPVDSRRTFCRYAAPLSICLLAVVIKVFVCLHLMLLQVTVRKLAWTKAQRLT